MTDESTSETGSRAGSRDRPSRRSVLGTVAATGTLVSVPTVVFGRQDGENDGEGRLEVVADFEPPSLPENLAIDSEGIVYLSMGPSGEIRAVEPGGTESSIATLETGAEGLLLGITILDGVLYAANSSGEEETHGVWRVGREANGEPELVAHLPADETMPNGIIPDPTRSDALLVSDHLGGAIWRVTTDGEAEPWVSHELLEPDMDADVPVGVDGLAVHPNGDIYADNLNAGSILRVPITNDGSAGRVAEIVRDESLVGADGMTFDEDGALYVAVNAENEIVRITAEHDIETIASGSELDFPADVHFGTTEETATSLYVANFAYGTFLQDESAAEPSLARMDVDARGHFPDRSPAATETAADE